MDIIIVGGESDVLLEHTMVAAARGDRVQYFPDTIKFVLTFSAKVTQSGVFAITRTPLYLGGGVNQPI